MQDGLLQHLNIKRFKYINPSSCMEKCVATKLKPWYLYMIECHDNSIYTGITINVAARYALHISGKGARYTRSHPPKKLMLVVEYPDHSSALKAESYIKKLKPQAKRKWVKELTVLSNSGEIIKLREDISQEQPVFLVQWELLRERIAARFALLPSRL